MNKKTTTVLFDASPMIGKKSGVGHFTERLLLSLSEENNTNITAFYFDFLGRNNPVLPKHPSITYKPVKYIPSKAINIIRRLHIQPPLEFLLGFIKYDFAIFTNYVHLPSVRRKPFAVAVHDLGVYDCPEYVSEANLKYIKRFMPKSIINSDIIITISEFTRDRIKHYFGNDAAKKTILLPIPYLPSNNGSKTISKQVKGIIGGQYLLFVGTVEPRKNISNLIKAYSELEENIRNKYKLVLAGNWGWRTEEIQRTLDQNNDRSIIITGYVTDFERNELYKNADLVVMVSHYEGFGMPALEAMAFDKKLLLSDIPVFHEVAGNYARYCNPNDILDIKNSIVASIKSPKPSCVTKHNYSWKDNSRRLMSLINSLVKEKEPN